MKNIELNSANAVWLDHDYVSVTFSLKINKVRELLQDQKESDLLRTCLGEAALIAIRNVS
jgi:hypothetical protein